MAVLIVVSAVSFLLGWRLGQWWVGPLVYVMLALAAVVVDPRAGPGEHDVSRWAYAVFSPIVPAFLGAIGTVVAQASRPRQ